MYLYQYSNDRLVLQFNSSDGQVVRAFANETVDSGLIMSLVRPITLRLVFTAPLFDAQQTTLNC